MGLILKMLSENGTRDPMLNVNSNFLPSIFDRPEVEMAEKLLSIAMRYPQVAKILPVSQRNELSGEWARYQFDGTVDLFINTSHPEAVRLYQEIFQIRKERIMTKALTRKEQDTVKNLLAQNMKAIASVLPKHLTPERMLRVAFTTIVQNPELARCTQLSLINGVVGASILGLEIGGPLGLAHLIPYKNNKTSTLEATLIVDYKGYIELMYKSSQVKNVQAHPVYEKDQFSYTYGTKPYIEHKPFDEGDPGKLIYGYCIVFLAGGAYEFEVVNEQIAMDAKKHSMAKDSKYSPWNTEDEWTMWVKTAVRRIAKRIPKSPELQRAIEVERAIEQDDAGAYKDILEADFTVDVREEDKIKEQKKTPEPEQQKTDEQSENEESDLSESKPLFSIPANYDALKDKEKATIDNYLYMIKSFPDETMQAVKTLNLNHNTPLDIVIAVKLIGAVNSIIDQQWG